MAEIKNTFLKSKMNKDLDDRLIPNGEYRDARNIAVGKSEDSDVGALENVIGNKKAANLKPYTDSFDIIGYYADDANNRIITFVTNYTDSYIDGHPTYASVANEGRAAAGEELFNCHICVFNKNSNSYSKIVSGDFLNFSKTDRVLGISLIEDLLFFTDNRNQPRKINITKALNDNNYYSAEHNISVAKYSPFEPISLLKVAKHKPHAVTTSGKTITFETASEISDVEVGMSVIARSSVDNGGIIGLEATDFVTVESIAAGVVTTKKQYSGDPSFTLTVNDEVIFLKSTMSNEQNNAQWPGDPKFMEEKFIRFSYRFKFDDGEYSLAAPFTQIAYVPKQKGYFFKGDEDSAFRSTIVDFMSNEINNAKLVLPLPTEGSKIISEYKIAEVDILYKESDSLIIKVLESIDASEVSSSFSGTNQYVYDYQSRKPFINLTEADVTRVYDKVPVKARAQETSGNRIMYGNFYDKYTAPANIDYNVGVFDKDVINDYSFLEYPNHTVKQNRNYQVGFVLSDKFGRQSPVILSPIETSPSSSLIGGSTIYHSYPSSNPNIKNWFGDQIQVKVNKVIASGLEGQPDVNKGEPGLYALPIKAANTAEGFSIETAEFVNGNPKYLQFTQPAAGPDGTGTNKSINVPVPGSYLRGANTDYVKVTTVSGSGTGITIGADGAISDTYLRDVYTAEDTHDIKFAYKINPIGWYSYKVVVKQSEQEYYNCYLPGVLNGYPIAKSGDKNPVYPTNENGKTAHVVLINDNINKIPRDLVEVGPEQKQYRSSVELFGRVENFYITTPTATYTNKQYYPGRKSDLVSTIAQASELASDAANITSPENFYQVDTDPLIGRISTLSGGFGTLAANMEPKLAVYETKPTISLLDIFWETSSTGLISDLNEDVLTGFTGAVGLTTIGFNFSEAQDPSGTGTVTGDDDSPWITNAFYPLSAEGEEMSNTGYLSAAIGDVPSYTGPTFEVRNANDVDVTSRFTVYQDVTTGSADIGSYRVKLSSSGASYYSPVPEESQFTFRISLYTNDGEWTPGFTFQGSMQNENAALQENNSPNADIPTGSQLEDIKVDAMAQGFAVEIPRLNNIAINAQYIHMTNGAYYTKRLEDVGVFMTSKPKKRVSSDTERFRIKHATTSISMVYHSYTDETLYGGQQVGHYDYTFDVKDAMADLGSSGYVSIDDTGTETANTTKSTYDQKIIVAPDHIPSGLKTSCVVKGSDTADATRKFGVTNLDATGFRQIPYQWYIGSSNTPIRPDDAADWTGSVESEPHASDAGPQRIGSQSFSNSTTDGTIQLDLMTEVRRDDLGQVLSSGRVTWKIWYRPSYRQNWGVATDTNGTNFSNSSSWNISSASGANTNSTRYSSVNKVLAFSKKGEYFIQANVRADGKATTKAWVNINDANYPTCVPCFGKNLVEDSSTSGQDSSYFQYEFSTGSDNDSNTCDANLVSGGSTGYARTPYPCIVTQIYDDSSFTTFKNLNARRRSYDYKPGTGFTNLSVAQVATLKNKRLAYFNNMTQSSTTSDTGTSYTGWKTNKFYIDTNSDKRIYYTFPGSGNATRIACDATGDNNKIQTYAFNNYSI